MSIDPKHMATFAALDDYNTSYGTERKLLKVVKGRDGEYLKCVSEREVKAAGKLKAFTGKKDFNLNRVLGVVKKAAQAINSDSENNTPYQITLIESSAKLKEKIGSVTNETKKKDEVVAKLALAGAIVPDKLTFEAAKYKLHQEAEKEAVEAPFRGANPGFDHLNGVWNEAAAALNSVYDACMKNGDDPKTILKEMVDCMKKVEDPRVLQVGQAMVDAGKVLRDRGCTHVKDPVAFALNIFFLRQLGRLFSPLLQSSSSQQKAAFTQTQKGLQLLVNAYTKRRPPEGMLDSDWKACVQHFDELALILTGSKPVIPIPKARQPQIR